MDRRELDEILRKHALWLNDQPRGERANLRQANLRHANLRHDNLNYADLSHADLSHADLTGVDLTGVDLDFSAWPLWCGSFGVKIDKRLFCQLAYHLCRVEVEDAECKAAQRALAALANQFHRVEQCGRIEEDAHVD